jgi:N-methylhydantoinase A/oxoprolinase/acetone carboxylase beta subunit
MKCLIGIDVGGTNTDCAVINDETKTVVAFSKTPTTSDITTGVEKAIQIALEAMIYEYQIMCVMIGTTHVTLDKLYTQFSHSLSTRSLSKAHSWRK